ncbi:hypothetical protein A4A49_09283 [Nicotiana attenuata]|uniref:Uncharacterized protein n=1 Tax=Nicotiana attenuata TaxID=49451 RepID=A0A1J6HTR7_NICAT|nr:hypothetical protein A4A49_09283 [Nicotiana attenuata]
MCVMIRQKRSQQGHGCKTPVACAREDSIFSITGHTGLPRHDTGQVISIPKPVSPDIETSSSLPLYVPCINTIK